MKIQLKFIAFFMIALGLAIIACSEDSETTILYEIGDTGPGGGIVFYVTEEKLHGLEVAIEDQGSPQAWSTIVDVSVTGLGTEVGTGQANSTLIMAQNLSEASAAKECDDYDTGWFLPSKDELNAVWVNLVDTGAGDNNGEGDFGDVEYWSSSEVNATTMNTQNFTAGAQNATVTKDDTSVYIRCIRTF